MRFRLLAALIVLGLSTGCLPDKKDKSKTKRPKDTTKDESRDVTFQSFAGRLRTAVDKRDKSVLFALMEPSFGYRWDSPAANEDVFTYWDRNGSWAELANILQTHWAPYDGYMVVPPQFAADPENYRGYRAGARMVNGAWRFSYFVPAPPAEPSAPELPAPASL